jgi:hypothetical protein
MSTFKHPGVFDYGWHQYQKKLGESSTYLGQRQGSSDGVDLEVVLFRCLLSFFLGIVLFRGRDICNGEDEANASKTG